MEKVDFGCPTYPEQLHRAKMNSWSRDLAGSVHLALPSLVPSFPLQFFIFSCRCPAPCVSGELVSLYSALLPGHLTKRFGSGGRKQRLYLCSGPILCAAAVVFRYGFQVQLLLIDPVGSGRLNPLFDMHILCWQDF